MLAIDSGTTVTEKWIVLAWKLKKRQLLIATHIECPEEHGPAFSGPSHVCINRKQMLFGRSFLFSQERDLATKKTNAFCPVLECNHYLFERRRIGSHLKALTVL